MITGSRQKQILALLRVQPGMTAAQLDRATNAHGRVHHVTYDAVKRLERRRLIRVEVVGSKRKLYVS